MARKNVNDTGTSGQKYSVEEFAKKDSERIKREEIFAATKNAVNLIDFTKGETRNYTTFSRELLRGYLKNPMNYESRLRNLSQFLYRLSYAYRKIVLYYARMIDASMWYAEPTIDFVKSNNDNKTLKDYAKVVTQMRKMDMASQLPKFLKVAWLEGSAFGFTYEDNDGFYIQPLPGDYCKISSVNFDGTFNFAFDLSYLQSREYLLEYWDPIWKKMYNAFQGDTSGMRWQEVPTERSFVIKMDDDDPTLSLPVFLGLFESLLDLLDLQSIQQVKDSLSAYKMIVMVEKTLEKATEPDQFTVDIDSAIAFYNRLAATLPPQVSSGISLLPIETIEFAGTTPEETERLSKAMKNIFDNASTTSIFANKLEGSVAFNAAIIADSIQGLTPLPQIEKWTNRYIQLHLGNVSTKIKYLNATPYTKADIYTKALEGSALGLPMAQIAMAASGIDSASTYYLNYMQTQLLKYQETFIPLNSSYTQSGKQPAGNTGANIDKGGHPVDTGEANTNVTTETRSETTSSTTTTE